MADDPRICEPGGSGMLFPGSQAEHEWHWALRAVLYAAALVYLFYGVNIGADKFMSSIEEITSKKRAVVSKTTGRIVTVQVWNDTVATLTLLALGSSAPEILLSIVEIMGNGFKSGEIGPSTIVGSAAFNLFLIIGVCVSSIPSTEVRRIKELGVFWITAVSSLLAYIWLVFIVQVSSPDRIEPWEALVTLAMFPALVVVCYLSDIGYWLSLKQLSLKQPEQVAAPKPAAALSLPSQVAAPHSALALPLPPPAAPPPPQAEAPRFGRLQAPDNNPFADAAGQSPSPFRTPEPSELAEGCADAAPFPLELCAGTLAFPEDSWEVCVGLEERTIAIPVCRRGGTAGAVSCKYRLEGLTARAGRDFVDAKGVLTFEDGVAQVEVCLRVLPKTLGEHSDQFQLVLEEPEGGACFDPDTDGGEKRCVLTVSLRNENDALADENRTLRFHRWVDGVCNKDAFREGTENWKEEISNVVFEVGDLEEGQKPTAKDYVLHAVALPWRLFFALVVPPPQFLEGWIAFVMSLLAIGALTAVIIDFAELFGCVTDVQDSITAITFVALGTSMPDLFASITAASKEEFADASIVNVTGSNSVNVFLGIGLPWLMGAVYWACAEEKWAREFGDSGFPVGSFIVKGGSDLSFGVMVFIVAALLAFFVLKKRRDRCGGELGGPYGLKVASTALLACLWVFYICLSIWKVNAGDVGFWTQIAAIAVGVAVLEHVLAAVLFVLHRRGHLRKGLAPRGVELDVEGQSDAGGAVGVPQKLGQYSLEYASPSANEGLGDWPTYALAPEWAGELSGLRGAGAHHIVACEPRTLGMLEPPVEPGERKGSRIFRVALVVLFTQRLKRGCHRGAHAQMLAVDGAPLRRSTSFESSDVASADFATPCASVRGVEPMVVAEQEQSRLAGLLGNHCADLAALSVAAVAAHRLASRHT